MAILVPPKDQLKQSSVTVLRGHGQTAEYLLPGVGIAQQSADFAIKQSKKDARRLLQAFSCNLA
jgi:hypothetical protein